MSKKTKVKTTSSVPKTKVTFSKRDANLLPKISLWFFDRPRLTALLALTVFLFGILSYTTLLKREGFPSIDFPIASINGAYFVNDADKVDKDVASPISEIALKQQGVKTVTSQSSPYFYTIFIQYDEGIDANAAAKELETTIKQQNILPSQAQLQVSAPYFGPAGATLKPTDMYVSFYSQQGKTAADLNAVASEFVKDFKAKNLSLVSDAFVDSPFQEATNPLTGQVDVVQKTFDRYGQKQGTNNNFYNSVIIGVAKTDGADLLEFDHQVKTALEEVSQDNKYANYSNVVSASFADDIEENISELQRELIIALIAVLIIGSLVIAIRASLVTVMALVIVILGVMGILYILGLTLNVITLFALILSLALIVDDTIIMVEAIDAQRKKQKNARKAIDEATHKISRAMISATSVAVLSFAPLLFVSGTLGSFIRVMPTAIISALILSLFVALIFIPFMSRYLLLRKSTMGEDGVKEIAAGVESKIAKIIIKPMLWAKNSRKRLVSVGLSAVLVGLSFVVVGGYFASKVGFNIFPQSKDANDIQIALTFDTGTDLSKAQEVSDNANKITADTLKENFNYASYYNTGNEHSATLSVKLISYNERGPKAPDLVKQMQSSLDEKLEGASVKVAQVDAGPPPQPFVVAIETEDTQKGYVLANDVKNTLENTKLVRTSGEVATITNVTVSDSSQISRVDNKQRITVTVEYDGSDTSTLFLLTQSELEKVYTDEKVESFGLPADALVYDLGSETENQKSFATLGYAFPALLFAIFILLAVQFKSLLQPLLIFMAIPFSFFGISLSLYLSDNPFSFFAMLGFFALIGLSIKNTILLTDYANQAKRAGMGSVDAMAAALQERFRPLVATSLTAVVALVPLSIISPFWQGLAILIIFGLLSSTLLVITVFPYYYLAAEFIRNRVSRKKGLIITATIIALIILLTVLS